MSKLEYLFKTLSFQTIPLVRVYWHQEEWNLVLSYLAGGDHTRSISKLEQTICELTGSNFGLAVNRGGAALQLALEAYQFPKESEVILPSFSCVDIIYPIIQTGLKPVLVDVDGDFNISADSVRAALSSNTRAIIMPHLSGKYIADAEAIVSLASANGVKVIDDACQAFGLQVHGKWAGTFGDVGIYSFGLGKTLFGPGGGMLVTDDETVIEYIRHRRLPVESTQSINTRLREFIWSYGLQKATHPLSFISSVIKRRVVTGRSVSTNKALPHGMYQMSGIEAALAHSLTGKWEMIVHRQREYASSLLEENTWKKAGMHTPDAINHNFTKLIVTTGKTRAQTTELIRQFHHAGIEATKSYIPLHLQAPFRSYKTVSLPETDKSWQGAFWLPMGPNLSSSEINRIKQKVHQLLSQ